MNTLLLARPFSKILMSDLGEINGLARDTRMIINLPRDTVKTPCIWDSFGSRVGLRKPSIVYCSIRQVSSLALAQLNGQARESPADLSLRDFENT